MKISAGDMMRFCQLRLDEIPLRIFTGDVGVPLTGWYNKKGTVEGG